MEEILQLSRYFVRMLKRDYRRSCLEKSMLSGRLSIITGQRGAGKTVFLIQYLLDFCEGDYLTEKALYLPVDHFSFAGKSLFETARHFSQLGCRLLCVDEIHKYPAWSKELKSIYDTYPGLKVVATGSSALEIRKGSHDLSRRAGLFSLPGLSFREFMGIQLALDLPVYSLSEILNGHEKIAAGIVELIESRQQKILALFRDYLVCGCFPYFQEFPDVRLYHLSLEQNMHYAVESDLPAIYPNLTGASILKIKRLLAFIAGCVPFTPDLKSLKQLLEIGDERTLKTYLKYLEDCGVIRTVSRSGHGMRELAKPEKIYLDNPNQLYAIAGGNRPNIGNLRETFFLNAIARQHAVTIPIRGDFLINHETLIEVGGKNKGFSQVSSAKNSFLAIEDIEIGIGNKVPLWLFGLLH
jgi:predicted AAA+ superfamily ATPase